MVCNKTLVIDFTVAFVVVVVNLANEVIDTVNCTTLKVVDEFVVGLHTFFAENLSEEVLSTCVVGKFLTGLITHSKHIVNHAGNLRVCHTTGKNCSIHIGIHVCLVFLICSTVNVKVNNAGCIVVLVPVILVEGNEVCCTCKLTVLTYVNKKSPLNCACSICDVGEYVLLENSDNVSYTGFVVSTEV